MILYPSVDDLLEQVDSRYSLAAGKVKIKED